MWVLLPVLFLVVLAAYQPAWPGQMLWDDDAHLTRSDLRSLHGLWRIWFDLGATQQYYPLVHSVFWLQFNLWGDNPLGYHVLNIGLHATSAWLLAIILRRLALPVPAYSWRRDLLPLVPFFVLGVAGGLTTAWVERTYIGAQGADFNLTLIERALVAARAVAFYLGKLVWPANLIFIYPRWAVSSAVWWQYLYILGVMGLLAGLWFVRRRTRGPLAALLYFGVTVGPALGFLNVYPLRYSFVADHFQYLASIGIISLLAAAGVQLILHWTSASGIAAEAVLIVALGIPLAWLTRNQTRQYVDAETLYAATLERNPQAWLAHENLGVLRLHSSPSRREEAVAHFREALRIKPDEPQVHNNLGTTLMEMGRLQEALDEHRLAVRFAPGYAEAYGNLGADLQRLGRFAEAADAYRQALDIKPDLAYARVNLGVTLQNLGRPDEAGAELREASRIQEALPAQSSAENYTRLGAGFVAVGRFADAVAQYEAALRVGPDSAKLRGDLGYALWRTGRLEDAATELRHAVRLQPGDAASHANLANILQATQQLEEAVTEYKEALRLQSGAGAPETHNDLGVALARLGRREASIAQFQEAVRLKPDYPAARANLARAISK